MLTVEQVRRAVERADDRDRETADCREVSLYRKTLKAIRDRQCENPRECARVALTCSPWEVKMKGFTLAKIPEMVEDIDRLLDTDWEAADGAEVTLYRRALTAIVQGTEDAVSIAAATLKCRIEAHNDA